jgi:hypothetical protein
MKLRVGGRYRSQVDGTEVIVVKTGTDDVSLTCGGVAMIAFDAQPAAGLLILDNQNEGSVLGKRYVSPDVELLVTRGGDGTLASGGHPLLLKSAKPLPASD